MQRYTKIRTVGLCHSVQVCSEKLLEKLGMEDKLEGRRELIAGINHMGWLLELHDKDGNDLYPEIRRRQLRRMQPKNMTIWCALSTSNIWDIIAPNPANITQNTTRYLSNPDIRK